MRFHIIALVVLIVGLVFLLNFATEEPIELTSSAPDQALSYDFFMNDVDSTHFSLDGSTKYHLKAKRSTHYPNPDYTMLEAPDIIIYRQDQPPWFVTAKTGRVEKDVALGQDRVELIDDVVLHHINAKGEEINIYTEFLRIYPDTKKLDTDREVLMESPSSEAIGFGMTADLVLNQINLLADVRGRLYEQK